MEAEFWLERWRSGRTGFHQDAVHPDLLTHWSALGLAPGATVLVPLCGKSRDMRWLVEQGHRVVGVELSEIAVRAYFEEASEVYTVEQGRRHRSYRGGQVQLLAGDFFDLLAEDLPPIDAFYDRAAMVALPSEMRRDYVTHLARLLASGCPGLLISMCYDTSRMSGPPFSVSAEDLYRLYTPDFHLRLLSERSGPEVLGALKERGLEQLSESAYSLRRR